MSVEAWAKARRAAELESEKQSLIDNLRAYIKLVYPGEMTPHAKRILEQILDAHSDGSLRCENCGKTMAEHDAMAHCHPLGADGSPDA